MLNIELERINKQMNLGETSSLKSWWKTLLVVGGIGMVLYFLLGKELKTKAGQKT